MTFYQNMSSADRPNGNINDITREVYQTFSADGVFRNVRRSGQLAYQIAREMRDNIPMKFRAETVQLLPNSIGRTFRKGKGFERQREIPVYLRLYAAAQFLFAQHKIGSGFQQSFKFDGA